MKTLVTGRESMTSKERVRAFFRGEETDRVPINMAWNPLIRQRVMDHFQAKDNLELIKALGVDFMGVGARYAGPELFKPVADRNVDTCYGWRTRWVDHGSGGYWDYCDFPLKDATVDDVAAWPFADPALFTYDHIAGRIDAFPDMSFHCGNAGIACIINNCGFLRSMEQVLIDLITDDPAGLLLMDKLMDQQYGMMRRTLEAGNGKIDFMWMGEDLGTQIAPLISQDIFRKHIRPRQQKFFDLAKEFGTPTLLHTCGSSSWAYEDYIQLGLTGVDTLQPEAANMSPEYLKKQFGARLVFHGCISSTGALSFGTPDDVEADCRQTLEIMMPGGGYAFSPTHCLQDNTPTENVIRMYETVHRHGWY